MNCLGVVFNCHNKCSLSFFLQSLASFLSVYFLGKYVVCFILSEHIHYWVLFFYFQDLLCEEMLQHLAMLMQTERANPVVVIHAACTIQNLCQAENIEVPISAKKC